MKNHTHLPWDWSVGHIYPRFEPGEVIASTDGVPFASMSGAAQKANAAFIVHACNTHDELVAALKELSYAEQFDDDDPRLIRARSQAIAALAKAETLQEVA